MSEEVVETLPPTNILGEGNTVVEDIVVNPTTDTSGTWMDGMSDENVGLIQNHKKWENANDVVNSYVELEKFRGASEDDLIRKPKEGESWDSVHKALGRPDTVEEYVYNAPEGFDGSDLLEGIREVAFSNGMSAKAFTELTGKYDEILDGQRDALTKQVQIQNDIEIQELKQKLGPDFDRKVHMADQAAVSLGFDQKVADALRDGLGVEGMLDVMNKMHDALGEDTVNSTNNVSPYGQTMESMKAEKAALLISIKRDPTRLAEFNRGMDNEDRLKYDRLNNSIHS